MPPHDANDLARGLLERAKGDEALVRKVLDDETIPNAIVGVMHSRRSRRPSKRCLLQNSISFPRTHDLGFLIELVEASGLTAPAALANADRLQPWAVEFRCETVSEPPLDRESTLQLVEEITAWAGSEVGED